MEEVSDGTGDLSGRSVWIIQDLIYPGVFVPSLLFALQLEDFQEATAALTEYEVLQKDYQDLDKAFKDAQLGLQAANSNIRAANKTISSLELQARRSRILAIAGGTAAATLGVAVAVLAILYAGERSVK